MSALLWRWGIPFSELTADDLTVLLCKLEEVPDIEDHLINTFLVNASERDAVAVIGLLLKRITRSVNEKLEYRALPILGFNRRLTDCPPAQTKRIFYERYVMPQLDRGGLSSTGYHNCSEKFHQASSQLRV